MMSRKIQVDLTTFLVMQFYQVWGLAPSPNCECGTLEQTADHVLTARPIHRTPNGARGRTILDFGRFSMLA